MLEVHVAADADLAIARTMLGDGEVRQRTTAVRSTSRSPTGAAQSLEMLRSLEDSGVTITDFQLRRPTLDDVFLALTGSRPTDSEVAAHDRHSHLRTRPDPCR